MAALHQQRAELRNKIGLIIKRRVERKNREDLIQACLNYHAAYTSTMPVNELKAFVASLEREELLESTAQGAETPLVALANE